MSQGFDPYYEWLGIQPKDQPPNYYRLLGVELFEPNAKAIANAADRQMAHLKACSAGPQALLSQKLLNEVSAARVCLLNAETRAKYDEQLQAQLKPPVSAAPTTARPVIAAPLPAPAAPRTRIPAPAPATPLPVAEPLVDPEPYRKLSKSKPKSKPHLILGLVAAGILALGGIAAFLLIRDSEPVAANAPRNPAPPEAISPKPTPARPIEKPPTIAPKQPRPIVPGASTSKPADSPATPNGSPANATSELPMHHSDKPASTENTEGESPDEPTDVYLDDLQEQDFHVGYGTLGKNGKTGFPSGDPWQKCSFRGAVPPHALAMHAAGDTVYVVYQLPAGCRRFRATAGMLGDKEEIGTQARFRVLGDNKVLWTSRPIQKNNDGNNCNVDIRRVKELRLEVLAVDYAGKCWTAWINPRLERGGESEMTYAADDPERHALPSAEQQANARKLLRETFAHALSKAKKPEGQMKLAGELLARGRELGESPADQFVLFDEARKLAAAAGNYTLASEAVEELAAGFQVNAGALRMEALIESAKKAKSPADFQSAAQAALDLLDGFEEASDWERAEQVAKLAVSFSSKARDLDLAKTAKDRSQALGARKKLGNETATSREKLATESDDPETNLTTGDVAKGEQCISYTATYSASSVANPPLGTLLTGFGPMHDTFAFCTNAETGAHIIIDLGAEKTIRRFEIENRRVASGEMQRAAGLTIWVSSRQGERGQPVWQATEALPHWNAVLPKSIRGRFVTIGLPPKKGEHLHLASVKVFGSEKAAPRGPGGTGRIRAIHRTLAYPLREHPADAVGFRGHWYKHFSKYEDPAEAQRQCAAMGGYLVCLETEEEYQFIRKMPQATGFLFGLYKAPNGKWSWINGQPLAIDHWAPGEPTGDGLTVIFGNDQWNDFPTAMPFVCEWEY